MSFGQVDASGMPSPSTTCSSSPTLFMSTGSSAEMHAHADNDHYYVDHSVRQEDSSSLTVSSLLPPPTTFFPFPSSSHSPWDSNTGQTPTLHPSSAVVSVHPPTEETLSWSHAESYYPHAHHTISSNDMWKYEGIPYRQQQRQEECSRVENYLAANNGNDGSHSQRSYGSSYGNSSPKHSLEGSSPSHSQQKGWVPIYSAPSSQISTTYSHAAPLNNYYSNTPSFSEIASRQTDIIIAASQVDKGFCFENFEILHPGDILALECPLSRNSYVNPDNRKTLSENSSQSSESMVHISEPVSDGYTVTCLESDNRNSQNPTDNTWKSDRDRPSVLVSNPSHGQNGKIPSHYLTTSGIKAEVQ